MIKSRHLFPPKKNPLHTTLKRLLTTFAKIALSAVAIWVVLQKIDIAQTQRLLLRAHLGWLLAAWLLFNASKVLSAVRLRHFFAAVGVALSATYHLRLYYVGMFYNLFLPGGIGGDGYKVYLLHQQYPQVGVRQLVAATLIDRLSGMLALCVLALVLGAGLYHYVGWAAWVQYAAYAAAAVMVAVFYGAVQTWWSAFAPTLHRTNMQALGVQLLQLACAYCLLRSLSIIDGFVLYAVLFLASSVVAVLPFTVGGVGARELVMVLGYQYLPINANAAVAFSALFFVVTAVSSLVGAFLSVKAPPPTQP